MVAAMTGRSGRVASGDLSTTGGAGLESQNQPMTKESLILIEEKVVPYDT